MKDSGLLRLGNDLYQLRIRANVTQREISDHLGYTSSQMVSNVERGICFMPADKVPLMCKYYGLNKKQTNVVVNAIATYLSDRYKAKAAEVM